MTQVQSGTKLSREKLRFTGEVLAFESKSSVSIHRVAFELEKF